MRNVLISSTGGGGGRQGGRQQSGVFTQHGVTGSPGPVSLISTCHRYTLQSVAPGLLSGQCDPHLTSPHTSEIMVFDSSSSSQGGRALWMENVMPGGGTGYQPHPPVVGLRSLPPYQPPPHPARQHYSTYASPWLVRVSHTGGGQARPGHKWLAGLETVPSLLYPGRPL